MENKNALKCTKCGKVKKDDGFSRCLECREREKLYSRERRNILKKSGTCMRCRKRPARSGKILCFECAVKDSNRRAEKKKRKE